MDDHPLALLAGVLVLGLGWHFFKLRRFRREGYQLVLDELAAAAGWSGMRRAWFSLGVSGDWMDRAVSFSVVIGSGDDAGWEYLRVRIDGATGANWMDIDRGTGGPPPRWWADIGRRHLPLNDPALDAAFDVSARNRALADWLFADRGLLEALTKNVATREARTHIGIRPHRIEVRADLPGSISYEVTPALLARLGRESWALAVLLTRRIALRPQ